VGVGLALYVYLPGNAFIGIHLYIQKYILYLHLNKIRLICIHNAPTFKQSMFYIYVLEGNSSRLPREVFWRIRALLRPWKMTGCRG
jgi:hypothetical protein